MSQHELLTIGPASAVYNGVLVKDLTTGDHYVVSTAARWDGVTTESLVFRADELGNADEGPEAIAAGGIGMTRDQAIEDLATRLNEDRLWTIEENNEFQEQDHQEFLEAFGARV